MSDLRFRLSLLVALVLFGVVAFAGITTMRHSCDTSRYASCAEQVRRGED
jgi:hypothetical protein